MLTKITRIIIISLVIFLTISSCEDDPFKNDSGTFTDKRDNHEYKWVKIGEQIWMAENLAYIPYVCPEDSQCGIWVNGYDDNKAGVAKLKANYWEYGCLYDWKTALDACPEGWHLPSDEEWMLMESYLGMTDNHLDLFGYRGGEQNIGGKLATDDPDYWNDLFIRTNETGFSAFPGGCRDILYTIGEYDFISLGKSAFFWTGSTYTDELYAINRIIIDGYLNREYRYKEAGFSIRCLKD